MCETLAEVVVAMINGMNVSLFVYQVNTTENVGQNLDPFATEYKDYCMNEGECLVLWKKTLWVVSVRHFTEGNGVKIFCGGIENVSCTFLK